MPQFQFVKRYSTTVMGSVLLGLLAFNSVSLRSQTAAQDLDAKNSQMIGQAAPTLGISTWLNSKPLDIKDLHGKVVLLRFLNDSAAGAAALNELSRAYGDQGLVIIGVYAAEPMPGEIDPEHVRQLATAHGFEFPIGLDPRWETMNRYWLQQADADAGATTFLIDRKGIVRYIQPDGMYVKNSRNRALRKEYITLETTIESLLKPDEGAAARKQE